MYFFKFFFLTLFIKNKSYRVEGSHGNEINAIYILLKLEVFFYKIIILSKVYFMRFLCIPE